MSNLAYVFILTLLHSLWQSAFFYIMFCFFSIFSSQPLSRQHLLVGLLGGQLFVSALTFYAIITGYTSNFPNLFSNSTELLPDFVLNLVFGIYLLVVIYRILGLIKGWRNLPGDKYLHKPNAGLRVFLQQTILAFGIRRPVRLWLSDSITSPFTFGWLRPVIILPVALVNRLTLAETEMLLLHELSHIRFHDYSMYCLLLFTEIIYFFNPFTYLLARQAKLEMEKKCDLQVVYNTSDPLAYAEVLLQTAQVAGTRQSISLPAFTSNNELHQRITFFNSLPEKNSRNNSWAVAPFLLSGLVVCVMMVPGVSKKITPEITSGILQPIEVSVTAAPETDVALFIPPLNLPEKREQLQIKKQAPSRSDLPKRDYIAEPDLFQAIAVNLETRETKELIITEETSGSSLTKAYKAIFVNGHWVIQPWWQYEKSKMDTSIQNDSNSLPKPFNRVQ